MNFPADLQRLAPIAAVGLVAVLAAVLVARGLGGSGSAGSKTASEPRQTLERTFASPPSSGKFEATGTVALQGAPSAAANPFTVEAAGAFDKRGAGGATRFRLDASVTTLGQKQSFRLVSNGSQAFLTAAGRTRQLPAGTGSTSFPVNPGGWLRSPVDAGTAQVDGVTTKHVRADVDVPKLLAELEASSQAGAAAATGASTEARDLIRDSVEDAHADVYTGSSDNVLRRLSVTGTVVATNPSTNAKVSGRLVFVLRITDAGKPQAIEVPRATRPHPAPAEPHPSRSHGGRKHAPPKHPSRTSSDARLHRSKQGYVTCVQGANDLQALQRCQALLP